MAEDSDKIKNTIPPSLNVQQSNCINDDLIIEETESNTDGNTIVLFLFILLLNNIDNIHRNN